MAMGVLGRRLIDADRAPEPDASAALRAELKKVKAPAADGVMVLVHELEDVKFDSWPIEKNHVSAFRRYTRPYWQETRFLIELEKGGAIITVRIGSKADPVMVKKVISSLLDILRPELNAPEKS